MEETNENHVFLRFYGFSCPPEEISTRLGLAPSRVGIEGEEYAIERQPKLKRRWKRNFWEHRVSVDVSEPIENHSKALGESLALREDIVRQLSTLRIPGELEHLFRANLNTCSGRT